MNQEVQDYIKKAREAKMNDEQIKQELLKAGWKDEDINRELNVIFIKNKGIVYYYLEVLKKYAIFKGRARRKEYWYFFLANVIIGILLTIIGSIIRDRGILGILYSLSMIVPGIAVIVRRLHDTNHSGWWWFIGLIPIVGTIILLVFTVSNSQPDTNQYGPNPKE